jgi:hypothetical protein
MRLVPVPHCPPENSIVRCQEDVSSRLLGACHVKGVECVKPQRHKLVRALNDDFTGRHRVTREARQVRHTGTAFDIRRTRELGVERLAPECFPFTYCHAAENRQDGLGLDPDAVLELVVEGPIVAACIQIQPHSMRFLA